MTDRERELYEKHQTLSALMGVLLHELRNPLHGALLIVEAMAMKSADIPALRERLKNQFTKLDGILSEAAGPVKALALAPRVERVSVEPIVKRALAHAEASRAPGAEILLDLDEDVRVRIDPILLELAVAELLRHCLDPTSEEGAPTRVAIRTEKASTEELRVIIESDGRILEESSQASPFTLATGGIRLALARALTMSAGGSLRLDRSTKDPRLLLLLPIG